MYPFPGDVGNVSNIVAITKSTQTAGNTNE